MTAAPAPADLRTRVLARLGEPTLDRSVWRTQCVVAVPAFALVITLLVVGLKWRDTRHAPALPDPRAAVERFEGRPPLNPQSSQRPEGTRQADSAGPSTSRSLAAGQRAARDASMPEATAPGDDLVQAPIEPLAIQPMQLPALAPEVQSALDSIGVAPLTLSPLSPEGDR